MPTTDQRRDHFERLFRDHFGPVLAYCLRRAGAEEAQDAAAETFLVAWRRLEDVPASERAWLLGTARSVLANQRRGQRRASALVARLVSEPPRLVPGPEPHEGGALWEALGRLPEQDREVLLLIGWDRLDRAEAAEVLGCSRAALRIRLHRARRRVQEELARQAGEHPAGLTEPNTERGS